MDLKPCHEISCFKFITAYSWTRQQLSNSSLQSSWLPRGPKYWVWEWHHHQGDLWGTRALNLFYWLHWGLLYAGIFFVCLDGICVVFMCLGFVCWVFWWGFVWLVFGFFLFCIFLFCIFLNVRFLLHCQTLTLASVLPFSSASQSNSHSQNTVSISSTVTILSYSLKRNDAWYQAKKPYP